MAAFAKRSQLNILVSRITISTAPRVVSSLYKNIKDDSKKRNLRDTIQSFVHGYCSSHECGTKIANAIGYNVILEDE